MKGGSLPACNIPISCGENVGHTIPQKITGTCDFQLSLRVRKPIENVVIRVMDGDREIVRRKVRKALPAEMIQFTVKAKYLTDVSKLEVFAE